MEIESLRSRVLGIAGLPLDDAQVIQLLSELVGGGGGVHIEIDDGTRYRLVRRDGRFMLVKEPSRARPSTMPPRR